MWLRALISLCVFLLALLHGLYPKRLEVDWPSVTLVVLALLVLFAPQVSSLLPFIKRVKVGNAEIELSEKAAELHKAVEQSEVVTTPVESPTSPDSISVSFMSTTVETEILNLAAKDKESAVVKLAIEIEKELYSIQEAHGLSNTNRLLNWRELLVLLKERGTISEETFLALKTFRQVRDKIIHQGTGSKVSPEIINSTIDSGIRLLRILKSVPR